MNIVIVDYGCSNIKSVKNAIEYIGYSVFVSDERCVIESADIIVLPGVGSYDFAVTSLKDNDLEKCIYNKVIEGTPIIGICLGFQLLFEGSDEGKENGLGLLKGRFRRFNTEKVNMGWRNVNGNNPLISNIDNPRYYFVHSYYLPVEFSEEYDLFSSYHDEVFTCGVMRGNICGVQFHPEKSHKYGLNLLKQFIEIQNEKSNS